MIHLIYLLIDVGGLERLFNQWFTRYLLAINKFVDGHGVSYKLSDTVLQTMEESPHVCLFLLFLINCSS